MVIKLIDDHKSAFFDPRVTEDENLPKERFIPLRAIQSMCFSQSFQVHQTKLYPSKT